jgi:hypothetical protein
MQKLWSSIGTKSTIRRPKCPPNCWYAPEKHAQPTPRSRTESESSPEAKIFMVTGQEVDVYPMTELMLLSSTRLKSPLFFQCFVGEHHQDISNNSMATFARQGLYCVKPAHCSPHAILGSKSCPSRTGNRIKESALLGETLWFALHSNG